MPSRKFDARVQKGGRINVPDPTVEENNLIGSTVTVTLEWSDEE